MKGKKTGGRGLGTPNKATSPEASIFQQLGGLQGEAYAEQLHKLAAEPHGDPHVRVKAIQIIAPYLWKRLPQAVEHSGPAGGPIVTTTVIHEHHPRHAPKTDEG